MTKRVAILQSNYIPWKGYFDIIHDVDEFVFHDDLQYTKQDWRNRNLIKTPAGTEWLTIPVGTSEKRKICEVELPAGSSWARDHWRKLLSSYETAPYLDLYAPVFENVYLKASWRTLSELNQHLIRTIARDILGIRAEFHDSRELNLRSSKQDRVLDILEKIDASAYVSGPSAKSYIDPRAFAARGIDLIWKDYAGYPEYPQVHPPFVHQVTILDLLFHAGPRAPWYIWGWRSDAE